MIVEVEKEILICMLVGEVNMVIKEILPIQKIQVYKPKEDAKEKSLLFERMLKHEIKKLQEK